MVVGQTGAGLVDDAEAVEEVKEDKGQDEQGNDEKFQDNNLLVPVLAVLHLLELLLDHHHAVHAASAHLALPQDVRLWVSRKYV